MLKRNHVDSQLRGELEYFSCNLYLKVKAYHESNEGDYLHPMYEERIVEAMAYYNSYVSPAKASECG